MGYVVCSMGYGIWDMGYRTILYGVCRTIA